jgi:hypothetical protein
MASTFKLTLSELAALLSELESQVGLASVMAALVQVLGVERATALVRDRVNGGGVKITKAETAALVLAMIPALPGATVKLKLLNVIKTLRRVFPDKARFNALVELVKETITAYYSGGQGHAIEPGYVNPLIGYGLVNNWRDRDAAEYVQRLVDAHVGIVAFEFFEDTARKRFLEVEQQLAAFEPYLELTKQTGQKLYVTKVNGNTGIGKHGDPGIPLRNYNAQIMRAAEQFAVWMAKYPHLYVTPVGEGGARDEAYDRGLQNWCKAHMPLAQLVNNWKSRPAGNDGMGHRCVHPAGTSDIGSGDAWVMSDHTLLIQALMGSLEGGKGNIPAIVSYGGRVIAAGRPFIFYHFDPKADPDENTLSALSSLSKPPATEPTEDPVDDIDLSGAEWTARRNGTKAIVTQRITAMRFTGTQFYIETTPGTRSWQPFSNDCNQLSCIAVKRNGRFLAAAFDWQRPGNSIRDTKNITIKELGWKPNPGEPTWYFQMQIEGKERTSAWEFVWK